MLSTNIKEATKTAHLELEKKVINKLKAVSDNASYAELLRYFYTYFSQLQKTIAPFISTGILPDYHERRDSSYLKNDILALGKEPGEITPVRLPEINNTLQALGALYVMEGSIMGGSIIVKMLEKSGISTGFSFFSGYGAETGMRWSTFTAVLNQAATNEKEQTQVIQAALDTFNCFIDVFEELTLA